MNDALLLRFPKLSVPRKLYGRAWIADDVAELRKRNYEIVELDTVVDRGEWIEGALQGMLDGTLQLDKDQRQALELEMKARGMLSGKALVQQPGSSIGTVREVLSWRESRHTLGGNTVLVNPEVVAARALATAGEKNDKLRKMPRTRRGSRK